VLLYDPKAGHWTETRPIPLAYPAAEAPTAERAEIYALRLMHELERAGN
jgi:hypothetical protein